MKQIVLSCLAVFLAISFVHGQTVTPATLNVSGGSYHDPAVYHQFEWSIGEMVLIETIAPADSAFVITQGVLQPCTERVKNSPQILYFLNNEYKLYPNPTQDKFELNFFVQEQGRMSLQLVDQTGRVLERRSYQYRGCCRIEYFDLSKYPNGIYYVIADLKPDQPRADGAESIRHSGFKVVKMKN